MRNLYGVTANAQAIRLMSKAMGRVAPFPRTAQLRFMLGKLQPDSARLFQSVRWS
jgi:hypothetical protein